jgi:hypothetical protein
MGAAIIWAVIVVAGMVLAGFLFWVGARIAHVEGTAIFGRAIVSALFCGIVAAAVVAMVIILGGRTGGERLPLYTHWLAAVLIMALCVVILRNGLATTFPRAVAVWCCAVGLAAVLGVLVLPGLALLVDYLGKTGRL